MSLPSRMQHLRIDPATVVADDYLDVLGGILKLDFDAAGSRMAEYIHQEFPADVIRHYGVSERMGRDSHFVRGSTRRENHLPF